MAVRRAAIGGAFTALIGWVIFSGFGLVLWVGGTLVIGGQMSGGTLTAFVLYTFTVDSRRRPDGAYGQFQQVPATRRVFELRYPPGHRGSGAAAQTPDRRPARGSMTCIFLSRRSRVAFCPE